MNNKQLLEINRNSIFHKIKEFFKSMFYKNSINTNYTNSLKNENITSETLDRKNAFIKQVRKIEDEETKLLKLQKQYRNGEIKEEELSEEQVKSLCELYDKQIASLKKSNEIRRKELKKVRNKS